MRTGEGQLLGQRHDPGVAQGSDSARLDLLRHRESVESVSAGLLIDLLAQRLVLAAHDFACEQFTVTWGQPALTASRGMRKRFFIKELYLSFGLLILFRFEIHEISINYRNPLFSG